MSMRKRLYYRQHRIKLFERTLSKWRTPTPTPKETMTRTETVVCFEGDKHTVLRGQWSVPAIKRHAKRRGLTITKATYVRYGSSGGVWHDVVDFTKGHK